MKLKISTLLFLLFLVAGNSEAQSYVFGLKGGPSLASQKWNSGDVGQPMLAYHGALFMESYSDENRSSIFAQIGYHTRGTSFRSRRFVSQNGQEVPSRTYNSKHYNVGLGLGVKQKIILGPEGARGFYGFGGRVEYNLKNELRFQGLAGSVNKITYGLIINGGFEMPFSEYVGGFIELSFNPDVGRQIFVQRQEWIDVELGRAVLLPEQNVVNLTFELSVGIRFLHKIIYTD